MSVPEQSYAVHISAAGGPEVLQWRQVTTPQPGPGEILVRVAAAGVNRADLLQRRGRYTPPPGASPILGMEVSGTVAAIGSGALRWQIGDRVCGILTGGGYAEYVAAPQTHFLSVPENVTMLQAAALPECIYTVWANVFETAALKTHETLLVHGGSSGIGTTAIQMVKAYGAKIYVTVSTERKAEACVKLGADLVINYRREEFVSVVIRETAKHGVDVVLDMIGGDYLIRNLAALGMNGRHVSIASQEGPTAMVDIRDIMKKRLTLSGSMLRGRSRDEKTRLTQEIHANVWPWVEKGMVKPLIYNTFKIKDVAEAHKVMETGEHIGKIVLEVAV